MLMVKPSVDEAGLGAAHETDVVVIGPGPCGLFPAVQLGLLDINGHVVDILDKAGGQCAELYPEKPIYDIPGMPIVTGQGLADQRLEQIARFSPTFHLAQMSEALERLPDGKFKLTTELGTTIPAPVLAIA